MAQTPKVKTVEEGDEYYHVRIREPWRFSQIRTLTDPSKHQQVKAAQDVSKGAGLKKGKLKNSGNWKIQGVLIKKKHRSESDARRLGKKVVEKLEG